MRLFLNGIQHKNAARNTIILYASPDTITSTCWGATLKSLISRHLVRLLCVDECHYITSAGCFFRLEFYTNIRALVERLWNKCLMLFCSATMNKSSIHHTSLMMHPQSLLTSSASFPPEMGLDNPSLELPVIDPLLYNCFTSMVWGNVGRVGINMHIEFTTNWATSVKPFIVSYTSNRCRVMGYCSSDMDAKENSHEQVKLILKDAGIPGDAVVLTDGDGIMMKIVAD